MKPFAFIISIFFSVFALSACSEARCAYGSVEIGNRCEPISPGLDSSTLDGSASDAAAGSGGSGQPGSDSAIDDVEECRRNLDCPAARPRCDSSDRCVACTARDGCDGRAVTRHCMANAASERAGQCVACIDDAHCEASASGPYCVNNACAACRGHADCPDIAAPQCGADGRCVGCTDDAACTGRLGTELCGRDGSSLGQCVGCVDHGDCMDPGAP